MVTGRKPKPANEVKMKKFKLGSFHIISEKLQDSLISVCKRITARARKSFRVELK